MKLSLCFESSQLLIMHSLFLAFCLANECCERLAYYGISMNLVTYMTTILHLGNAAAATNVNNWTGISYISPFIGAFLADEYLGRYWTIAGFYVVYFVVSHITYAYECLKNHV